MISSVEVLESDTKDILQMSRSLYKPPSKELFKSKLKRRGPVVVVYSKHKSGEKVVSETRTLKDMVRNVIVDSKKSLTVQEIRSRMSSYITMNSISSTVYNLWRSDSNIGRSKNSRGRFEYWFDSTYSINEEEISCTLVTIIDSIKKLIKLLTEGRELQITIKLI